MTYPEIAVIYKAMAKSLFYKPLAILIIEESYLQRFFHTLENAFLQISKYGGAKIQGGKLFTTASPCELCSKKAYQLGIKEIYYIDPYPGISKSHVLTFGKNDNPKMIFFQGAIGNAYISLYAPRMPYKDEISLITGISAKEEAGKIRKK